MTRRTLSPRQTVCFALDTSQSMAGEKIRNLSDGLSEFFRLVKSHQSVSALTDVAVVTFGNEVLTPVALDCIAKLDAPRLPVGGATPLGEAVKSCLDQIVQLQADMPQKPAILILATDGRPTDDTEDAATLCLQLVKSNQLVVFPIAIGEDADADSLGQFAPGVIKDTAASALVAVFTEIAHSVIKTTTPLSVFDKPPVPWNEAMRTNYR